MADLSLEYLTSNFSVGRATPTYYMGRQYLVAPMTTIVPGVLSGSRGALLYPEQHIKANVQDWDGMPLTGYHPQSASGEHVSADAPGILDRQGLGFVRDSTYEGKLKHNGWFDVERVRNFDQTVLKDKPNAHILPRLMRGEPIELSTGLYTDNSPVPEGSHHEGTPYQYVASNYRPNHIAVLPDQVGACSLGDGCGVLVNQLTENGLTQNANPEGINQYTGAGGKKQHEVLASHGYIHSGMRDEGHKQLRYLASTFEKKSGDETHRVSISDQNAKTKEGKLVNVGKWRSEHHTPDDYKHAYRTGAKSLKEHLDKIHGVTQNEDVAQAPSNLAPSNPAPVQHGPSTKEKKPRKPSAATISGSAEAAAKLTQYKAANPTQNDAIEDAEERTGNDIDGDREEGESEEHRRKVPIQNSKPRCPT